MDPVQQRLGCFAGAQEVKRAVVSLIENTQHDFQRFSSNPNSNNLKVYYCAASYADMRGGTSVMP